MLFEALHVRSEDLLKRRKSPAFGLEFHEPRLTIRKTRNPIRHPALRGRPKLVGDAAQRLDGPHKISFDLAFFHKKIYCIPVKENLVSVSQQSTEVI